MIQPNNRVYPEEALYGNDNGIELENAKQWSWTANFKFVWS